MQQRQKQHLKSRISPLNKSKGGSKLGSLVFLLILVGGGFALLLNFQTLVDWYALRSYTAPAIVKQYADQDTMTSYARKVFYVNHPEIVEKSLFSKSCPDATREHTIVLGCYHGNQKGIFLLKVSDNRLNGVEQVTAAHEMLHAAYDRLDDSERSEIDRLLKDFYENKLTDERIKKTIDAYKKTEPNDLVNEMHSIFATEVVDLTAELENYYKQYFDSRKTVAQMSIRYQAEFTSRQNAVANYDIQLEELKQEIERGKADIESGQNDIDTQKAELDRHKQNENVSQYNAGVPVYNNLIDSYNRDVQNTKNLIARYNDIVAARNTIAVEQDQLVEELKGNSAKVQE